MRETDRLAIEIAGIPSAALMENAGRAVADEAAAMAPAGRIAILCGHGSNGGDGYVAARHLDARGREVTVVALDAAKLAGDALANRRALAWTGARVREHGCEDAAGIRADLAGAAVLVDAVFGTGLAGPVREPFPALFASVQSLGIPILAVDIPSGLDADTGEPLGAALRATRTLTLHAPKAGFARAAAWTGDVRVADIGIPSRIGPA
jgi:NAD(P)H-hydrate epimerase